MRILLVKLSSMGDVVHNLPVVADLLDAYPQASIDWVVEDAFADLVALHPGVHRVIRVSSRRWRRTLTAAATRREVGAWLAALRSERYDAIVDTQSLVKSALVACLARGTRVGWRAGACREKLAALFYDKRIDAPRYDHVVAVERYRDLCAQAFGYTIDTPPRYGLQPTPERPAWLPPSGPYAVLLTATSRAEKRWAASAWVETTQALLARGVHCAFAWGSALERDHAASIVQAARADGAARACVAPEPMSLARWAAVLAGASVVVGVDTGLAFLATAVGTPVVAIYVATAPSHVGIVSASPHRNLGDIGAPPSSRAVIDAAFALMPG